MYTVKDCVPKNEMALGLGPCSWQKMKGKNNKQAKLTGSTHIDTELDRVDSYPRQLATLDPTWPGEAASDQKFGRKTNNLLHITKKVINFSL